MGMFDNVVGLPELHGLACGHVLNDFQTKDHKNELVNVDFKKIENFYTHCGRCDTWHEFTFVWPGESDGSVTVEPPPKKRKDRKIWHYLLNVHNHKGWPTGASR